MNGRLVAVWYLEPTYSGILYTTAMTTNMGDLRLRPRDQSTSDLFGLDGAR